MPKVAAAATWPCGCWRAQLFAQPLRLRGLSSQLVGKRTWSSSSNNSSSSRFPDQVAQALAELAPRRTAYKQVRGAPDGAAGRAAVLIGLCHDRCAPTGQQQQGSAVSVLFTVRAQHMRSHAAQVAFPGGREDAADGGDNPVVTALRELEEELGIDPRRVRVLGLSHDSQMPREMRVTPVVAWLGEISVEELRPAPAEVDSAFLVPLAVLREPANRRRKLVAQPVGGAMSLPVYGVRSWVMSSTARAGAAHEVWGLTAVIVEQLLEVLGPAFDQGDDRTH
jgi:8-oxo-dGTP pyrophosphatase MutT (NUDIX family)